MLEQMNMLKDAIQALLSRLPPLPSLAQESISQEHHEQSGPIAQAVQMPQVQSTTTPTMVYSQPQLLNTLGLAFPATLDAHGAMQQAPTPFTQIPIGSYTLSSSNM